MPSLTDVQARELVAAKANVSMYELVDKLTSMVNAQFSTASMAGAAVACFTLPGVGLVFMPAFLDAAKARRWLIDARDRLKNTDINIMLQVIRDPSIPVEEVTARAAHFVREYAATVDAQLNLANGKGAILKNTADAFLTAVKEVLEAAGKGVPDLDKLPTWVVVLGGVVGVAAVASFLRS